MTKIFISYRRSDDPGSARAINDALRKRFGKRNVYFDLDSIKPGRKWRKNIDDMIAKTDVMLVVIGDRWFQLDTSTDSTRLNNPEDLVRLEISSALKRKIPVIPVLVGSATIPDKDLLPDEIDELAEFNAAEVRATSVDFQSQLENLLTSVRAVAPPTRSSSLTWTLRIAAVVVILTIVMLAWQPLLDRISKNEPEMVVIPAGSFVMGSSETNEQPQHRVTVPSFAMGKYEVTFAEYDAFARSTGNDLPYESHWGRGKRPVINVSWKDAQAYVKWLKKRTGKQYRLPSEAEWEYSARAGTKTKYWWGDTIDQDGEAWANCHGCGGKWDGRMAAPVGKFPANPFGLHDMAGHVSEWVEDCWHDNYSGKERPDDGSAWLEADNGQCLMRVIRGGAFSSDPKRLRSAYREGYIRDSGLNNIGFRLAQDLPD